MRTSAIGRWNKVAAAVLGGEAVFVLAAVGQLVVGVLPDLASADAHHSGHAWESVLYAAMPIGLAAAFALVVAWRLWQGRPHAPVFALICTAAAGLLAWLLASAGFNRDELFFWVPGVLAVGSGWIVVLLAAGWLLRRRLRLVGATPE